MKVAVIGGGIAGLFAAWYLAREGQEVVLLEKDKLGHGCTQAAAGMLAPINELEFTELDLLKAGMTSRALYDELQKTIGFIGLQKAGTLEVGLSKDDESYLRRLYDFQLAQGLPVEWLEGREMKSRFPWLSRNLQHAIWSPRDIQVDQYILIQQLRRSLVQMRVEIRENEALEEWKITASNSVSIFTQRAIISADAIVLATGLGSEQQLPLPYKIYPIRGEMVALRPPREPFMEETVRIRSHVLGSAYVVPKGDRILCGSTSEEKGLDKRNTAGGLLDILRKCYAAVPGIYELEVLSTWAGLRPATLNRLPVIDREGDTPVFHVNGLYRHGILLGPLAGKAIAKLILEGEKMPEIEPFGLD